MSDKNLDLYLLKNWQDLEDATNRGNAIDNEIHDAITTEIENWAKAQRWCGVFESGSVYLAPPIWVPIEGKASSATAWFLFDVYDADSEHFWLTALTGKGAKPSGFRFRQNQIPAPAWKAICSDPEFLKSLPDFEFSANTLFIPFQIDMGKIIEGAEADGDYSIAASAILPILERLQAAATIIDSRLALAASR